MIAYDGAFEAHRKARVKRDAAVDAGTPDAIRFWQAVFLAVERLAAENLCLDDPVAEEVAAYPEV
jgi:hypothetical protein